MKANKISGIACKIIAFGAVIAAITGHTHQIMMAAIFLPLAIALTPKTKKQ